MAIARDNPAQTPATRNGVNRYTFLEREIQPETGYMDLMKRFYDPSIGRFMQVDPVTDTQENYSTYQYGWNNPILRSDPNGDLPIWGFVIGAGVDYGFQVAGNLASGTSLSESLTRVDLISIGISGVAGLATSGFSAIGGKTAQFAIGTGIDAAESVTKQVASGESISLSKTASDVIANKAGVTITKRFENIVDTKQLTREADRTARVSAKDPTSTGRAAKADAAKRKLSKAEAVNSNLGQTASGVAGNGMQNASDGVRRGIGTQNNQQGSETAMPSDATNTKSPPILIRYNK